MKKQVYNPFLPLNEYIADGEPHVFGDRLYLFGSHDKENGETFCMLDYVVWSAPIDDLTCWTNSGVVYQATQDPLYDSQKMPYMFAPDVVQGNDGRFYLYYCMAGSNGKGGYSNPISVAVCSTPDGKYKYLGNVRSKEGQPLMKYICFDPAVINDDGTIRLYYGASFAFDEYRTRFNNWILNIVEAKMLGRSVGEIKKAAKNGGIMGAISVVLDDDMITAKTEPKRIISNSTKDSSFADHYFFEGSSIRKINDTYYFIYSSRKNHELCYATSKYPDREFIYGGTIVSNGDIGYKGRTDENKTNTTGTNHGSITCVNGQWYVFYHRLTHLSDFSRQACAEPITILKDGTIPQVEITSCGLNKGPLSDNGKYPAAIACMITNGQQMPHGTPKEAEKENYPCVYSQENEHYIKNISNNTKIGYKYFEFQVNDYQLTLNLRGAAQGYFIISTDELATKKIGKLNVSLEPNWKEVTTDIKIETGINALFFTYIGTGKLDFLNMTLKPKSQS
ncbi:family 43 glycosylhydrolase [Liquorilactobacillus ghanensis]|uniref:family 43 glycosylhydrolase n=1 Tax=Liquorilactobacillus ghanensis TaxID=399370 RepID=UPI0039EB4724